MRLFSKLALRRVLLLVALCFALAVLVGVGSASASVVWDVRASTDSTVAPGGSASFYVWANNEGSEVSGGTVTLTATLPAGLTLASVTVLEPGWSCSPVVVGSSSVSCTTSATIAPRLIGPPSFPQLQIAVNADPDVAMSGGVRSAHFELSGGGVGAVAASTVDPIRVTGEALGFGVGAFDNQIVGPAGEAFTQAGGHPYAVTTAIDFNRGIDPRFGSLWPVEPVKDVVVDLSPGFIGDPKGLAQCTAGQLANSFEFEELPLCPTGSQVGVATVIANYGKFGLDRRVGPVSVFNMVPPSDAPAEFGFNFSGTVVTLVARVRSGSDYGVSIDVKNSPEAVAIVGSEVTFWGVPADPSHTPQRSCPGHRLPYTELKGSEPCSTEAPLVPFLRNPTSCEPSPGSPVSDGLVTNVHADSWLHPGAFLPDGSPDLEDPNWKSTQFVSHEAPGYPASPEDPSTPWGPHVLPTGCEKVPFDPKFDVQPASPAATNTQSGFSFDLSLPQNNLLGGIGEGDLRKLVVKFPAGVRVSPSSAQGLAACSPEQIGLHSTTEPSCPDGSKLGTVTVTTPLLEAPLSGYIYLATPHDNPFDSLISVYLVVKGSGVIVKLAGKVDPDPATGQLTATFDNNPQTPFSDAHIEFEGGPRASLVTPSKCGTYTTTATLTSWSGKTVASESSFPVSGDGHGAPCPPPTFAPAFNAGVTDPTAGGFSPFGLELSRSDSDSEMASLSALALPPGLLADIASVPTRCTVAQANAAACPAASHIGEVTAGAGPGPDPYYVKGDVYLTKPLGSDPFGVAVVVHAAAGPFDLGYVVVKSGLQIHNDGSVSADTEPFPTILQGIPLQLRDIRLSIDRPHFMLNPTNCNPLSVQATVGSTDGQSAYVASRFRAAECARLSFRPSFKVSTGAKVSRNFGASLKVVVKSGSGQANIRSVKVKLPRQLASRLETLQQACREAFFNTNPASCPSASVVGSAKAISPILATPLTGPAYFVSHGGAKFPELVVVLQGEGVTIDLAGETFIDPHTSITSSTFRTVPDAPVSSFELTLPQGRYSALGSKSNLCKSKLIMPTLITGQNGAVVKQTTHIAVNGCPKAKRARGSRRGHKRG